MLFTELPLLQRPARRPRPGFDAIEFWWPFTTAVPADGEVDAFARAVTDAGVQLIGLNFFAGDMPGGDRGLVSWPGRSTEFRDNIDVTIGLGERLGCKAFNALYGNRVEDSTPEEQDDVAAENLALPPRPRRPHRCDGAGRTGQRRAAVSADDRRRRRRGDRPGGAGVRRHQREVPLRPVPPGHQRRRRRRRHHRPQPPGSVTCRSPTARAGTNPEPESSTSRPSRRADRGGLHRLRRPGVQAQRQHLDSFDWLPREQRASRS